jgi:hypothetical protein
MRKNQLTESLVEMSDVVDVLHRVLEKQEKATEIIISKEGNLAEAVHYISQASNLVLNAKNLVISGTEKSMASIRPAKTPNSYNRFVSEMMAKTKVDNPNLSNQQRFAVIAKMWKEQKEGGCATNSTEAS